MHCESQQEGKTEGERERDVEKGEEYIERVKQKNDRNLATDLLGRGKREKRKKRERESEGRGKRERETDRQN